MPIESTILAYQSLQLSAQSIANSIDGQLALTTPSAVIIATPADIANILQLRVLLAQERTLYSRVRALDTMLTNGDIECPKISGARTPLFGITGFTLKWLDAWFATPSSIAGMISTIASLTSQTESATSTSGALTDATLMSLVATRLNLDNNQSTLTVFVPSIGQANLFSITSLGPDIGDTYLGKSLQSLDSERDQMQTDARKLLKTQGCLLHPTDPQVKKINDLVSAGSGAVDGFENALLGIPTTSSPSNQSTSQSSQTSAGNPPGQTSPAGGGPNPQNTVTVTTNVSTASAPGQPSTSSSTPLAQLIGADLLLTQIQSFKNSYMLAVHALESGGSQLTKQQIFLGSRVYDSGGAVATFQLISSSGRTMCSGVAYGYRGMIQIDDVGHAITDLRDVKINGDNRLPDAQKGQLVGCSQPSPTSSPPPAH